MSKLELPFSTHKILVDKVFDESINESWLNWAIEMMEKGFESDNLFMLAGMEKPFNQFEMKELTDKVLADFNLKYDDKDLIILNYTYYLIKTTINNPLDYLSTLSELKDICMADDFNETLMPFYKLFFAKEDLIDVEVQWYWPGANRNNIDSIIHNEFNIWIDKFKNKNVS